MDFKKKFQDNRRKSDVLTLKEGIDELLKQYRLKGKFNQVNLIASWEKIMGKTISTRTEKIFFKDKTLFVQLNSAPLKHQLSAAKAKVVELVNKEFEEELIDDVKFI